jgi:MFS family permease
VFVFSLTLTPGFLDRGVLTLLVEPIKRDLHLTDTQISLVIGFVFVIFYLVLGLPLGRWIDTGSRRLILGLCVTVWSIGTALCGAAHNFVHLGLARLGVGAADAATSPAISSMISDLFPKERLARALSVMAFAFIAGNGLSMLLGAAVIHLVDASRTIQLPLLGEVFSWQMTFFIVGLPGLIVALLYLTVREPARRGRMSTTEPAKAIPVRDVARFMMANWTAYAPMFLGLGLRTMVAFGISAWTPALFSRNYGWTASQFGYAAGIISLTLPPIGLIAGIRINEWLFRRGYQDANARMTAAVAWLGLPGLILMPIMPTPELALAMFGWAQLVNVAAIGSQNAALLVITPNQMRGQISALYLFVFNAIGYGLGPTAIALFTDFVFGSESQLHYAMFTAAAVLGPIAAVVLSLGVKPYARAFERAKHWH